MEKQFGNKRYTLLGDAAVEKHIVDIVNGVVQRLVSRIKPVSVFLSGSLAKGEVTAFRTEGKIEIVSDFEIGVVDWNWTKKARIRKIQEQLTSEYGIDLTLLFFLPRRFKKCAPLNWAGPNSPLSIEQYELMKSVYFVYGRNFLNDCRKVNFADIPRWEVVRLLFSRMAELVGVLSSDKLEDKKFFKACDKLLIACGDALLLNTGSYHHLYSERKKLFEQRYEQVKVICSELSRDELISIIAAYDRKVYCKEYKTLSRDELLIETLIISEKVFKAVIYCLMKIDFSSVQQFCEDYLNHPDLKKYSRTNARLENMVSLLKNRGRIKSFSIVQFFRPISINHKIYADIYQWLMGCFKRKWEVAGFDSLKHGQTRLEAKKRFQNWESFNI